MLVIVATTLLAAGGDCTFERMEVVDTEQLTMERTCFESYDSWVLGQFGAQGKGAVSRINEDGKMSITADYVLDVLSDVNVK